MMKKTILSLSLLLILTGATVGRAAEPAAPGGPQADPLYIQWDQAWRESRRLESDIFRLKHDIAFLQLAQRMELSQEQCKKLLSYVIMVRDEGRTVTKSVITYNQDWNDGLEAYWQAIVATPAADYDAKIARSAFDSELWNKLHADRLPTQSRRDFIETARNELAGTVYDDIDPVMTVRQRELLATKEVKGQEDANRFISLLAGNDGWATRPAALPLHQFGGLASLYATDRWANSWRATGPLDFWSAPAAVEYVAAHVGPKAGPLGAAIDDAADNQNAWQSLRLERRLLGNIALANWALCLKLSPKQLHDLQDISRSMTELYLAEETAYAAKCRDYVAVLTPMRDALKAGQPIPAALGEQEKSLSTQVARSYIDGAAQGGAWAEDGSFQPKTSGLWRTAPDKAEKLLAAASSALTDSQRTILWHIRGDCFHPAAFCTGPANIVRGLPDVPYVDPELAQLRNDSKGKSNEQRTALRDAFVNRRMDDIRAMESARKKTQRWIAYPNGILESDVYLRYEQGRLGILAGQAASQTDAQYVLNKAWLSYAITGKGIPTTVAPCDDGVPQAMEQWPKLPLDDTKTTYTFSGGTYTAQGRYDARLESMLLPDMFRCYQIRSGTLPK